MAVEEAVGMEKGGLGVECGSLYLGNRIVKDE